MPTGANIDLGNDYLIPGLSAAATDALLVPAMDVSQYKSLILTIKNNAYSGTLLFEWSDEDETTWNAMNLFEVSNTTRVLYSTHTTANGIVYGGPILFPSFRVRMNPYTSGAALATLQLSRQDMPGIQISTDNVAIVLDGTNKIGYTRNDGSTNAVIAASVASDTVVSAVPGMLARILVTTLGTHEMVVYDNASAGSGNIIGIVPASTTRGTLVPCMAPAMNGITVKGDMNNPAVTIFYS
jgi:hypothetical protein